MIENATTKILTEVPVSIKPETYEVKKSLPEDIKGKFIFYKKLKDGIAVDYGEIS